MKIWDELNENFKGQTRNWVGWARKHAQELGEVGMRHVERQDLLGERRREIAHLGEQVANRFILEDKKSIRIDSPGIADTLDRIRAIDRRLQELQEEMDHGEENK